MHRFRSSHSAMRAQSKLFQNVQNGNLLSRFDKSMRSKGHVENESTPKLSKLTFFGVVRSFWGFRPHFAPRFTSSLRIPSGRGHRSADLWDKSKISPRSLLIRILSKMKKTTFLWFFPLRSLLVGLGSLGDPTVRCSFHGSECKIR